MKEIKIIHTNDIHSSFDKFLRIATIIKKEKNENSLILDAGDFNDFSSLITNGTDGCAGLKMLNFLGYDALTLGNNEGFQKVKTIEQMCKYNLVDILSCNLLKDNNENIKSLKKYIIKSVCGVRFLIIGVSPYLQSYNQYYNCYGIKAIEPYQIIRTIIKDNKNNYDFVILLSHLGLKADIMMSQSIPDINIIIGGHSHHHFNCIKVNNTYIHQSGVRGSHVGIITFYINNNKITGFTDENIEITDKIAINNELEVVLKEQEINAENNLKKNICKAHKTVSYSVEKECNFTNLLCDYLYNNYLCDFSLINSGMTENNIKKGNVSKENILNVSNSPAIICMISVKGKDIAKAIAESADIEKCFYNKRMIGFRGKFLGKLHISYNCKVDKNNNLYINKKLIEKDKYYKIVTVDLLSRGEGYKSLKKHKNCLFLKETIQEAIINSLEDKQNYKNIENKRWEEENER